jgi:hypothetical protein
LSLFLRFSPASILSAILVSLLGSFRSRAALQLEIVALRHQINVLRRSAKRPKLTDADRVFWAWLSEVWSNWRTALVIVRPETVIAWHRRGFRWFWTWKVRHGKRGRPVVLEEVRELIRRMSRENPLWGATHSRRTTQTRHRCGRDQRRKVYGPPPEAAVSEREDLPGEPYEEHRFHRLLHGADAPI